MDRAHWRSPSFRGRSPHPNSRGHQRFRGEGGGFGPQRHYSPHWQQRSPSPYRYQSQQGQGGGGAFSPHFQPRNHNPYSTSTPVHGSGGGRRPYFRGGGGRFNKRLPFGTPPFIKVGSGSNDDISNWISQEMWDDPWRHLTGGPSLNTTETSGVTFYESQNETQFANSNFNMSTSAEGSRLETNTETATTDDPKDTAITLNSSNDKEEKDNSGLVEDDSFEKYATDRVVLDTEDQVRS